MACLMSGSAPAASATVGALSTEFVPTTASTPRLAIAVGHGNSLTLDYFDRITGLLTASQAQHPAQVWSATNQGVGGAWTTDLITAFPALHARFFNPLLTCTLVFCELTNHLGAGASFAVARDAAISYCATARAAGWRLRFCIPTPRAERATPGYEASASAWQVGQKTRYEQCCDYFRSHPEHYDDMKDLSVVPALSNPYDTTYYLADGCHKTEAGIAAKAAAVATTFDTV